MSINPDLWPVLVTTFSLFLAVGFIAQLVDGAVGMAYGVISTSVLLAFGVPPAQASATIHAAECFTTGASGASHLLHKNVDWQLFFRLAPAGVVGGVLGAYLLTGFDPTFIKAVVIAYLGVLGVYMLTRALRELKDEPPHLKHVVPIGVVGGFLDASGGGGWGPIVTSTLIVRGDHPRRSIGSSSLSEFFVTTAVSAALFVSLDFMKYLTIVVGLIIGGAMGAPFAGWFSKIIPMRWLMIMVAVVIAILACANIGQIVYGALT